MNTAHVPRPERSRAAATPFFERYLSLWVALCIVAGTALGHFAPGVFEARSH